ncbi:MULTISPECIES: ABC transporter permease [Rhodococcus]|uniref:ABC transporter permease n=1 Tax=Rhodococcus oxybenzonivorans TaxID=1990687 RepID=A0AAE4UUV0_9NOCA|nr:MULTISPECIES: ABC transporter permease [Rhodococcus]MDV7245554.1 ABC transporter permease [Rhodococcus oxybenzonivorans]MDV7263355.1 ABC transporter permease [Rhodococcus oxybenzonivorans]MDV7276634.1 ABC transporter permease [Rhodococcus oxybenzonivorans]MDV7336439.1 ABC transporter permease [Rhodococcus oxybenzonivorans]MDV7346770.1 ABC transporter permease [Rhodococcus oxybenzonivorans]
MTAPPQVAFERALAGKHRKPQPSNVQQWVALTQRNLHTMSVTGQFFIAVLAPLIFTVGFYLPLRLVMKFQGVDYAQFVMPIIVLQAMAFTAVSAAHRAATESSNGMNTRFQTMPVGAAIPLAARMSASLVHSSISLVAAVTYGYLIGFRFDGGTRLTLGFCALAMLIGFALTTGADALGTLTGSPEVTSQALTLPQLILGMFSSGFVPVSQFPEWAQGFVRNQPISQFSESMRAMTEGTITLHQMTPTLLWCAGLVLAFVPLSIWSNVRRG